MTTIHSPGGKAVLTLAHVCGMIDMVALPLWVGALMQYYGFSAPQAGITVTVFLFSVVVASGLLAPRFNRVPRRAVATAGFALAALSFFAASVQPVSIDSLSTLALLHALAGLGVGAALSFTHGSIGRSANPHRLFATASIALGVFAVVFLAGTPQLIQRVGAASLFTAFAGVMAVGAVGVALFFPRIDGVDPLPGAAPRQAPLRIPGAAWLVIAVVVCLTMNQAMVFSFLERIGAERGFGVAAVNGVLIALGLVNLTPGVLAALLQKRWSPVTVGFAGPIGQAVLALVMSSATVFAPYALAASLYVFMVIFTHTFLFGLLTRLDASGRAAAATPAMMMLGSCIGPALGGAVVQGLGYPGLGWAACVIAAVAVICMARVRRRLSGPAPVAAVAA